MGKHQEEGVGMRLAPGGQLPGATAEPLWEQLRTTALNGRMNLPAHVHSDEQAPMTEPNSRRSAAFSLLPLPWPSAQPDASIRTDAETAA